MHIYSCTCTCTCTHINIRTHSHTNTHKHTQTHTNAHKHTQTHATNRRKIRTRVIAQILVYTQKRAKRSLSLCLMQLCRVEKLFHCVDSLIGLSLTPRSTTRCQQSAYTGLVTVAMKKLVGSLRPNFKALCGWDASKSTCTSLPMMISSSRQSFPSGHSSALASGMAYLSLFLSLVIIHSPKSRPGAFISSLLRPFVFFLPAALAVWVASTRLWDHFHRIEDVSVGLALGTAIAWVVASIHLPSHKSMPMGAGPGRPRLLGSLGGRERARTLQKQDQVPCQALTPSTQSHGTDLTPAKVDFSS